MKEHRVAHSSSEVQRVFHELNAAAGLGRGQIQTRQDTRFNSMLQEYFGGRKAIRSFLEFGKLIGIRLPPLDRPNFVQGQRRAVTEARARKRQARAGPGVSAGPAAAGPAVDPGGGAPWGSHWAGPGISVVPAAAWPLQTQEVAGGGVLGWSHCPAQGVSAGLAGGGAPWGSHWVAGPTGWWQPNLGAGGWQPGAGGWQ